METEPSVDDRGTDSAPPSLPDGALGELIGDPDEHRLDYCDEANWVRVEPMILGMDDRFVTLNEAAWKRLGGSAHRSIASWVSKCKAESRAVMLVGDESGRELARYSGETGFESLE